MFLLKKVIQQFLLKIDTKRVYNLDLKMQMISIIMISIRQNINTIHFLFYGALTPIYEANIFYLRRVV